MIVPDANLLLYAYNERSPHFPASRRWLVGALSGDEPVGLATATIVAFIRIATAARVFVTPLSSAQAIDAIDAMACNDHVSILGPGPRHLEVFRQLVLQTRAVADVVPDVHLATIAREHHGTVYTNDHDFDRFHDVRVVYPLERTPSG